mmetsp:Transcript_94010/g.304149  ORF Transcript_94010/g.304149 Transcript_94010/m.304149 type:complete len:95 (-) Transcript_94010:557-841(-)
MCAKTKQTNLQVTHPIRAPGRTPANQENDQGNMAALVEVAGSSAEFDSSPAEGLSTKVAMDVSTQYCLPPWPLTSKHWKPPQQVWVKQPAQPQI